MFDALDEIVAEHADLERRLADPAVHADPAAARTLGRRYARLTKIVEAYRSWQSAGNDLAAARELAHEDPSFDAEADHLERHRADLEERLRHLLIPRDPNDDKDVIIEIKAGEGGEESALFAADLLRMYTRYAERRGWKTEMIDAQMSDLGGYKDASLGVRSARNSGPAASGDGVWADLKYEGGVHRVQRVPATESQGRIHTSAVGVLVMPEADPVEVEIDDKDIRVDVFRSSGPGGQSVNTTDSAVRVTHLPTGIVASCQNQKSQLQNREQALRILRARLLAVAQDEADQAAAAERRSQVRTVDRSERVRTYNFPENRISDHRVGYKAYNLDQVLEGDLNGVVRALVDADTARKLSAAGERAGDGAGARGSTDKRSGKGSGNGSGSGSGRGSGAGSGKGPGAPRDPAGRPSRP